MAASCGEGFAPPITAGMLHMGTKTKKILMVHLPRGCSGRRKDLGNLWGSFRSPITAGMLHMGCIDIMDPSKAILESLEKRHQPYDTVRLLPHAPVQPERETLPWLHISRFLFLIVSCVLSIVLFWCLRWLEVLPRDGTAGRLERQRKLSISTLAVLLYIVFSYSVATMLPPAFTVVVWTMAGLTTLAGFRMFFVYREPAAALPV